jgi:AhpD family alkylhydroperoxidase
LTLSREAGLFDQVDGERIFPACKVQIASKPVADQNAKGRRELFSDVFCLLNREKKRRNSMANQKEKMGAYKKISQKYPDVTASLNSLGETIRNSGPIDGKTSQLIQLAAAAAGQSEGSVHSHTRRALEEGATRAEIEHALLLLISVMGFPKTAAAMSWATDILDGEAVE